MPETVSIESGGLAACCCATLLHRCGISVQISDQQETASPMLLLNGHTLRLLEDVWGLTATDLSTFKTVRRRVVQWQPDQIPTTFPHFGIVVNQSSLLGKLWGHLSEQVETSKEAETSFFLRTKSAQMRASGDRKATATTVQLKSDATDACWMEATESGWLFLMPQSDEAGVLLTVGSNSAALLNQSKLIARQVLEANPFSSSFAAMPRIADPLFGTDWLLCGSAAVGFDPICGEGAGNALREGILASAAIREYLASNNDEAALTHYASRLLFGFGRHLESCLAFYNSAYETQWWKEQTAALEEALAWTNDKIQHLPPARFFLQGFDLVSRAEMN